MSSTHRIRSTSAIIACVVAFAQPVAAQTTLALAPPPPEPTADDLRTAALDLVLDTERYGEAAALLVRAAALRAPGQQIAVRDLVLAGKLYAYAGNISAARATLEAGALRALSFDDVGTAAHAYIDAAFLAIQQGDAECVRQLTATAERLAASPRLNAAQRRDIMMRINPDRAK